MDGVETTDNLELLREIENSPGDGSEEALTPYGAKCVADELERLRTALAQAKRERDEVYTDLNDRIAELISQRDEARGLLREAWLWVPPEKTKLVERITDHQPPLRGDSDGK